MASPFHSTPLPPPADLQDTLSQADIDVLQQQYNDEQEKGYLTIQARFNLAWGLIKTSSQTQISRGVAMLSDLYRDDASRRRECLYYLALGHYKLNNYNEARRFNNMLLDNEPTNDQALSLASLIEKDVSKDGLIGLAIVGGVAAVGAAIVASFLKRQR